MKILNDIIVKLDINKVVKALRLGKKDPSLAQELVKTAESLIEPKALYKIAFLGNKGSDTVEIEGVVFSSSILSKNLEKIERVFPYVVTIGPELEREAGLRDDLLRQYYLETLGDMTISIVSRYLEDYLKDRFKLEKLSSMSPGSLEKWPITEQKQLFSLFQEKGNEIGVQLTDSMLMIPRKSVSGIYFPKEVSFYSCQLCERERCPGRIAAYDADIAKQYGEP
jgi:hypothetical protein